MRRPMAARHQQLTAEALYLAIHSVWVSKKTRGSRYSLLPAVDLSCIFSPADVSSGGQTRSLILEDEQ